MFDLLGHYIVDMQNIDIAMTFIKQEEIVSEADTIVSVFERYHSRSKEAIVTLNKLYSQIDTLLDKTVLKDVKLMEILQKNSFLVEQNKKDRLFQSKNSLIRMLLEKG